MRLQENNIEVVLGSQDFENSTVKIKIDNEITSCPMWIDLDGEIGFTYKDEKYYISYCN